MHTVSRVRLPEIAKPLPYDDTTSGRSALQGHPALRAHHHSGKRLPSIASAVNETLLQRSANAEMLGPGIFTDEPQDEDAVEQEQGEGDSDIEKQDNNREDLIQVGCGYKLYEPPRPNGPGADVADASSADADAH